MNSKLKLPFLHVYSKFLQLISPLQAWREGSRLVGARFLGGLLVILIATLPFLENAQTGVLGAAVAIAWLMLWFSDRRDQADQSVPIWTAIHLPLISYWAIALLACPAASQPAGWRPGRQCADLPAPNARRKRLPLWPVASGR